MSAHELNRQKELLSGLSDADLLEIVHSIDFLKMRETRDKGFNTAGELGNAVVDFISEMQANPSNFHIPKDIKSWKPQRLLGLFSGSSEIERFLARRLGISSLHVADIDFGAYRTQLTHQLVNFSEGDVFDLLLQEALPKGNDLIICTGADFLFSPKINDPVSYKGMTIQRTAVTREIMQRKLPRLLSNQAVIVFWFEGGANLFAGETNFHKVIFGENAIFYVKKERGVGYIWKKLIRVLKNRS